MQRITGGRYSLRLLLRVVVDEAAAWRRVSVPWCSGCPSSSVLAYAQRIASRHLFAWLSAITLLRIARVRFPWRRLRRHSACSSRLPVSESWAIDTYLLWLVHARRLSGTQNYTQGQALLCALAFVFLLQTLSANITRLCWASLRLVPRHHHFRAYARYTLSLHSLICLQASQF